MRYRFPIVISIVLWIAIFAVFVSAQDVGATPEPAKPALTPNSKDPSNVTPEQVANSSIFVYGFPGGRATLNQIRKSTYERGKMSVANSEGTMDNATYSRWIIRGDSLDKEQIRIEQDFPNAKYSLVYADDRIFGIFNNSVFTPREDAARSFEHTIFHGIEALLRYDENGSTLVLAGRDKIMGVDYYLVDVTDKKSRKTRFFVSVKTLRVMMLTYEDNGISYKRKFYNHKYAQGTLVPYRSVLTANDKVIEESEIFSITFGQFVDPELFKSRTP